jgi:hypothetical protein
VARKLIVEVAADISQYLRGMTESAKAAKTLDVQVSELNVDTQKLAETQVRAAALASDRLRSQAAAYRGIAASATAGSREQIAATRLAEAAEHKLALATGATAAETRAFGAQARVLERDLGRATRGALSGSGIFNSFGRSLAFASGGFIAFHEASAFIRDSINAAQDAIVSQRQLAAQMKTSGESFAANREKVEQVAQSYAQFGFNNDQVIQSLTVLERGTGNIDKAIALQGVTADIARAKNLDLAAAAQIVAKVFGGQETALRRAVPGLEKNAHGWDLIREAQAKMAGQAAAATTPSERFAATLHDTEEIIGTALLPTLNKYLDALGSWLTRMNESGRLQKDVETTASALAGVVSALSSAFDILNKITGSTKRSLEVLLAVWVAYKRVAIASAITNVATSLGLVAAEAPVAAAGLEATGVAATGAAAGVGLLAGALRALALINPPVLIAATAIALVRMQESAQQAAEDAQKAQVQTFKQGDPVETILVPRLAKQIQAMKAHGQTAAQIFKTLNAQLGDSVKSRDLLGEAFTLANQNDPALTARIRAAAEARARALGKTVDDALKKAGPSQRLRNTWFDAMITRSLGRVQDLSLEGQLPELERIAELIQQRINKTRDITRKLKLEDQLLGVIRDEKQVRQQLVDQAAQALQLGIDKAGLTATLTDDIAAINTYIEFLDKRLALVKTVGEKLDIESQIVQKQLERQSLQQQQAQQAQQAAQKARQERAAAIEAAQFRALGLGATGDTLIPGIRALQREADKIRDSIAGTFLDTRKTRSMLSHIRQVLAGGLGAVGNDVRSKIKEILDGIQNDLKGRQGFATRYSPASTKSIMAALGFDLSPAEQRRMQAVLAQLGPGGLVASSQSPAFGLAGAGGVTIHGDVHLHGVQDVAGFEAQLTKRHAARPHVRRGAR